MENKIILKELKIPGIYNIFAIDCELFHDKHEEYCSRLVMVMFNSEPKINYLPFGENGEKEKNEQVIPAVKPQIEPLLLPKEFIPWLEEMRKQSQTTQLFPAIIRFNDFPKHQAHYLTFGWTTKHFYKKT